MEQELPKHYLELIQETATKPKDDSIIHDLSTDHPNYENDSVTTTIDEQLNKLCLSDDEFLPNTSESLEDTTYASSIDKSSYTPKLTALDYYCATTSTPDTPTDKWYVDCVISMTFDYFSFSLAFR